MNRQDVMTMWREALRQSNDGRFDPSGKGASVHDIFAALVLEDAAGEIDDYLYASKASERLRTIAKGLKS